VAKCVHCFVSSSSFVVVVVIVMVLKEYDY